MQKYLSLLFLLWSISLTAQMRRGIVQEDFTINVEKTNIADIVSPREDGFAQMPGFPKRVIAHPTFKNFRNVTLADLTNDGVDEILMATNRTLYVYSKDTLLWSKNLFGVGIYPPSVADLDNDGDPEIVLCTGGQGESGRLYALDHTGQDLPGWPLSFDNNWMLLSPALADVNGDKNLEILACERRSPGGRLHLLTLNGQPFNGNFPVTFPNPPALTPSVGDLDGDGEVEIVIASTRSFFMLGTDGQIRTEISNPDGQRYSYQSPILVDLDDNGKLSIVGAAHGNAPQFFVMNADGSFRSGWPIPVLDNNWTFSTPSLVKLTEEYTIIGSRQIGENTNEIIFGWNKDAISQSGFPITGAGGHEGITAIADIDDDGEMEVIFGSNLLAINGKGFIHAYNLDGSGEVPGFPLRPHGWTIVNGANVGDVNADGMMDLVVLSYTQNFGNGLDSTYLNVYELNVPYTPERVLWSTYKGDNSRSGLIDNEGLTPIEKISFLETITIQLLQNPLRDVIRLQVTAAQTQAVSIELYDPSGKFLDTIFKGKMEAGSRNIEHSVAQLPAGTYWLVAKNNQTNTSQTIPFVKM